MTQTMLTVKQRLMARCCPTITKRNSMILCIFYRGDIWRIKSVKYFCVSMSIIHKPASHNIKVNKSKCSEEILPILCPRNQQ